MPQEWPTFLDETTKLIASNQPASMHAGLQALLTFFKAFRYISDALRTTTTDRISNRFKGADRLQSLSDVVGSLFANLVVLGESLLGGSSVEAAVLLHHIVKVTYLAVEEMRAR